MEFVNPALLWGGLALVLPVLLHFWHRKKGKELAWAAWRWLSGEAMPSARGIRLQNILLLLLRCLLLLLLVFYLAEPLVKSSRKEKVHWVQPKQEVVENFRFELEEAERNGERRYWFTGEPVTDLRALPSARGIDLQQAINAHSRGEESEIYLTDRDDFTRFSRVYLPGPYRLHRVRTDSVAWAEPGSDTLRVLLESDKETISAALKALTAVYSFHFLVDEKRVSGQRYDLSFTRSPDSLARINFVSNAQQLPVNQMAGYPNTLWFQDPLDPATSDVVFSGELPGIVLEAINRAPQAGRLSGQQLQQKFAQRAPERGDSWISSLLLLLFLILLSIERLLSIHKNA